MSSRLKTGKVDGNGSEHQARHRLPEEHANKPHTLLSPSTTAASRLSNNSDERRLVKSIAYAQRHLQSDRTICDPSFDCRLPSEVRRLSG